MTTNEDRPIVVKMDQDEISLHADFKLENNIPISGFVRIIDNVDGRIFWFNYNAISWIGPRS